MRNSRLSVPSLICGLVFVTTAASAQVPPTGPTGIPTAAPTAPGEITAACGRIPLTPTPAPLITVAAQSRGATALGATPPNYEVASREYWIAFATQPTTGRLNEYATALVGLDGPAQPRLCAALACMRERAPLEEQGALQIRQQSAGCLPQTNIVVPPGPNHVVAQRFTLSDIERGALTWDEALSQRSRNEHAIVIVADRVWTLPVSYRPALAAAVRDYQAYLAATTTTPSPRRSTLAWVGAIGGWSVGAAGLVTFAVEAAACSSANARSSAINAGQTLNWDRDNYRSAQDACLGANIGLGLGLAGVAGGTLTFLLTMPHAASTPAARRTAFGFTPAVSPGYTGVNVFGSF